MLPFRFGPPTRQLFGLYHAPGGTRTRETGVLICNPMGQEAVRTQRMFRVLGERLARAGWPVLRFDYFGTGDSDGDDEAGDLLGWRKDVAAAHQELLGRSGCRRTLWLGARLGGTLALLAAGDVPAPPAHLLLWEPVASGRHYLEQLASRHLQALQETYSIAPPALLQGPHEGEALGFALGAAMRQQLAAVDPMQACGTVPAGSRVTIVAPPGNADAASWADNLNRTGRPATPVDFSHSFDWTSEEALNTSLVPNDALQVLNARIEAAA